MIIDIDEKIHSLVLVIWINLLLYNLENKVKLYYRQQDQMGLESGISACVPGAKVLSIKTNDSSVQINN